MVNLNLGPENRLNLRLEQARLNLKKLIGKAILRRRLPFFKRLITEDKAWALFVSVVKKHIERCRAKKMATNYGTATEAQKKVLETMDIEIAAYETIIAIPEKSIKQTLIEEHKEQERALIQGVRSDVAEAKKGEEVYGA